MGITDNQRFQSDQHALTTGIVLGALMKAGHEAFGDDFKVRPSVDADGNYQQRIYVEWGGHAFQIDVAETIIEEDPF